MNSEMLVLSRKVGERIKIGDGITITVVRVSGGGVRLGIEAPMELPVMREEIYDQLTHDAGSSGKRSIGGDHSTEPAADGSS